jgi:curved DNA-binding protein CbpA
MAEASTNNSSGEGNHHEVHRILSCSGHFEVLSGITHRSSDDEVKRAYRTLALKTHPDKNKHDRAEEAFKRVHSAFQALDTQGKRDLYHRRGGKGFTTEDDSPFGRGGGFHHSPFGGNEFDFFNMFMGASMGGRGGRGGRGGVSMEEMMMMMMMEQMMNGRTGRGGFGGGFGGFGGFGGGFGGFHQEEEEEEDDEVFFEEGEEEDEELEGVYYDQLRDVFLCEGCGVQISSETMLRRHLATEEHQNRFDHDEDEEEDEDNEDDEDNSDENSDEDYDVEDDEGMVYNTRDRMYVCRPCGVSVRRQHDMETHIFGKKHKAEVNKEDFHCQACDVRTTTKDEKKKHLQGKKHLRTVRQKYKG